MRCLDSSSLVSLPALRRAYETLQIGVCPLLSSFNNCDHPAKCPRSSHIGVWSVELTHVQTTDDADEVDPSEINVEMHFGVIDAFDMPPVHFDAVRGGFTT